MHPATDHPQAVLAIFILTYAGLAVGRIPGLRLNRTGIALLGAIAIGLAAHASTAEAASFVNWPTIALLFGFFVISAQLRLCGFYDRVAGRVSSRVDQPVSFLAFLIVATAGLSAVLNNDIVCYVLTPVVGSALVRKNLNPVPFLVGLAAASNIGAAATLIGNAQNMLIGSVAHLGFLNYSLWSLAPVAFGLFSTFWVTRLGLRGGGCPALLPDIEPQAVPEPFDAYHAGKGIVVLAVVILMFFTPVPREVTVLVAASIHFLSSKFRTERLLGLVDWPVLVLFISLFIVSGVFQETGYAETLVHWLGRVGFDPGRNPNETILTAALSVAINNAPAVMLLVKIVPLAHAANASVMAVANSFAGNAVMTASVANIIVAQQARKLGITLSFADFLKFGLPITTLALGGLVVWASFMG
ncbi:MAG TPA: SLC13 family permease [Opitutaceae bacterium]|jgi:Na+/H+ antiporter NhaD/arsenite permease-like protein